MHAFKRQEVATHASIAECALWLAFGKLPEANWREVRDYQEDVEKVLGQTDHWRDGESLYVDSRIMPEEILEFEGSQFRFDPFLPASLLRQLAPNVNAIQYNKMVALCIGGSPDEVREQNQRHRENYENIRNSIDPSQVDLDEMDALHIEKEREHQSELEAAIWLNKALAPIRHTLSRAQSDVFAALADGRLVGHGVWLVTDDIGERHEDLETPWTEVARDCWTLEGVDWQYSNLKTVGGSYWGVAVATHRLLLEFPEPRLAPTKIDTDLFGDTVILRGEGASDLEISAPRARGQPQKLEVIAERLLIKHLSQRLEAGFPYQKEALIREAQVWAESIGVKVGRSTFDRTITRIMPDLPRNALG